jgi:hypothetical protein
LSPQTSTGKAGRTTTVRLADLVEDLSVYPRTTVNANNVRNLVLALEAGAQLPPLIACQDTLRLVDGFHRRRAYLRVLDDPDAVVKVELRSYATEADLLADAVSLNVSHGLNLQEYEKKKVVLRLGELGKNDDEIAMILRVPPPRITQVRLRVATVTGEGGRSVRLEPLKPSVMHLMGSTMTEAQAKAHRSAPGTSYLLTIKQLRQAIQFDLLNSSDGKVVTALQNLCEELTDYLAGIPTE